MIFCEFYMWQKDPKWIFNAYDIYETLCAKGTEIWNTVSQEPQCARFSRVFTCPPIV